MSLTVSPAEIVSTSHSSLLGKHASWPRIALGEVATVVNGAAFKSRYFNAEGRGLPLVRIRDVGQPSSKTFYSGPYEERYVLDNGDLIIGMDGDFRIAEWGGDKALLNQRVCKLVVRDHAAIRSRFLLYLLPGYLDAVHAHTSSVTVKHLSSRTVLELPIPVPALSVQDDLIEEIEKQFTRLDAAEATLKGALTRCGIQAASLIHYALRPKAGWRSVRVRDVVERVTVGHVGPMKHEYQPQGIPFLRSQNVRPNRFDPTGLRFISREFHERLRKSALSPGDVVVVRSGAVGTACVVPEVLPEANCSDLVVIQGPREVRGEFLAHVLNSAARRQVAERTVGVALQHFNTKSVADIELKIPQLDEQERIVSRIEALLSDIAEVQRTIAEDLRRATVFRSAILSAAFSGDRRFSRAVAKA